MRMNKLNFDAFTTDPIDVAPYKEIGEGIVLAYDKVAYKNGTVAQARCGKAGSLIVDCKGFAHQWFGLEMTLGDSFDEVYLQMRTYPFSHFYPRIYFGTGQRDLAKVETSTDVFDLRFTRDHFRAAEVLDTAKNVKISLLVPSSDWFVFELFKLEVKHG